MVQISKTERGWKELTLKQMLPGSSVTSSCTACGKPVSPFFFSRDCSLSRIPSFSHLVICDNSVFLLTFPNGGDQSPSTKPHTHNPPLSGVLVTLLLSPQHHSTSSGHGKDSPLRASPTLRNLLWLLDVCRREAAGLPWLEARAFRGSLLGQ